MTGMTGMTGMTITTVTTIDGLWCVEQVIGEDVSLLGEDWHAWGPGGLAASWAGSHSVVGSSGRPRPGRVTAGKVSHSNIPAILRGCPAVVAVSEAGLTNGAKFSGYPCR